MFQPATGQVVQVRQGEGILMPKGCPHIGYQLPAVRRPLARVLPDERTALRGVCKIRLRRRRRAEQSDLYENQLYHRGGVGPALFLHRGMDFFPERQSSGACAGCTERGDAYSSWNLYRVVPEVVSRQGCHGKNLIIYPRGLLFPFWIARKNARTISSRADGLPY